MGRIKKAFGKAIGKLSGTSCLILGFSEIGKGNYINGGVLILVGLGIFWVESNYSPKE